jgi:molybdopterin-containing oxidoreductase family iron-sulfur binding subunit
LPDAAADSAPAFRPDATADALPSEIPAGGSTDGADLEAMQLHAFASIPLGDGSMANNGHLQELPDPISKHTWGSYALISPATFQKAGLDQGDVIEIQSADGNETLTFPVIMQPGLHDDVISIPVGYGRTQAGTVGNDVGQNAYKLTGRSEHGQVFSGRDVSVSTTGENIDVAIIQGSQLVDLEQRPLMATATRDDYEQNHDAGVGTHPPGEGLWEEHDYDKKWGMSIDMSRCTGCAACMTACQEENNIPVVGRSGIMEGREMHWIRIDRYYRLPKTDEVSEARSSLMDDPMYDQEPYISFGDQMTNPQVLMQPMLCQHCENAPCETVCPVAATTHSDDGLNMMTYNRCVGTRYCSNNCPFKVRRFNWYNYSRDRSESIFAAIEPELQEHGRLNAEEPQPLALNPDVTVRSRGVMEKCTFCVQRIRRAKWQNIEEGDERFAEDDVVTACEQACPADAIDFGNLLDPEHRVTQQHNKDRAVTPLSHLNVKSSVAYLSDIRDTTQTDRYPKHEAHGGGHDEGGHQNNNHGGSHNDSHAGGEQTHGAGSDSHGDNADHGNTPDAATDHAETDAH